MYLLRVNVLRVFRTIACLLAAGVVLAAAPAWAQSLGAVAREAEAKRKTIKSTGKVYTNDQLKSVPPPTASTASAATPPADTAASVPPAGAADAKAEDAAKDEARWRERIKAEREALARAETFEAALQSQLNGLYAEFTACQAPPQCNEVSAKRQKSLAELDRVKKEVEQRKKGITDIQEEARRAGVPAGWVR